MNYSIESSLASDWPITLCFALLVAVALCATTAILKLKSKFKAQALRLRQLEKEFAMLSSGSVGMGQRLIHLQNKIETVAHQTNERSDSESNLAYARALRLLDTGADDSVIAANCGLSKSEIKLMQMVNHQKHSA